MTIEEQLQEVSEREDRRPLTSEELQRAVRFSDELLWLSSDLLSAIYHALIGWDVCDKKHKEDISRPCARVLAKYYWEYDVYEENYV